MKIAGERERVCVPLAEAFHELRNVKQQTETLRALSHEIRAVRMGNNLFTYARSGRLREEKSHK